MSRELKTLNEVYNGPDKEAKKSSVLGIIVDSAAPYRKNLKNDYVMRLKILDDTISDQFCSVFIYHPDIENFPKGIEIGDIIYLHNFTFELWQGHPQAKNFQRKGSLYVIFSGNPHSLDFEPKSEIDLTLINRDHSNVFDRLSKLREFSQKHFKANKIPLIGKNSNASSDFDLIMQVNNCVPHLQSYKVFLTDNVNLYELNHRESVERGVYKVRSIASVEWHEDKGILIGNDYTNFIHIPDWMRSAKGSEWEKLNKPTVPKKEAMDIIYTKLITEEAPRLTSLRQLSLRQQPEPLARIRCQFLDIVNGDFEQCLKKFDPTNITQKSYESPEGNFIYNIQFLVTDNSMDGDIFSLYLYTYDGKGNEFLPSMDPNKIYGKNTLMYRDLFEHVKNRLLEETSDETMIELLVSPLQSKTETIYRIVKTELVA